MAKVIFYGKTGCVNNEKQKNVLKNAGHELDCIDILKHSWSREELLRFLGEKLPAETMNFTAPDIKKGKISPADLEPDKALELMLQSPILIKRPLIIVEGLHLQGFTDARLLPYLGDWDSREDILTCPNLQTISCDEKSQ